MKEARWWSIAWAIRRQSTFQSAADLAQRQASATEHAAEGKAAGSATLTRALNDFFDMAATMRISARIYQLGGLQLKDMHVAGSILDDVKNSVAKAIDKTCLRWPDTSDLVDWYMAEPRGPIITGFPNGDHDDLLARRQAASRSR